jgi:hypothetical protein
LRGSQKGQGWRASAGRSDGRRRHGLWNERRARDIIRFNSTGTLAIDRGRRARAFGILNPLLAALIHVAFELAFILNSARLLPPRLEGRRAASPRDAGRGWRGRVELPNAS